MVLLKHIGKLVAIKVDETGRLNIFRRSSINESVLDEKIRMTDTSRSLKTRMADQRYNHLVDLKDIFYKIILCELPKKKGALHELKPKRGTKYSVIKQWPVSCILFVAINYFIPICSFAGNSRGGDCLHIYI